MDSFNEKPKVNQKPETSQPVLPKTVNPNKVIVTKWYKQFTTKIILLIVLLMSIVGYFSRNIILGTLVDVQYATTGDLTQTVVASGRVLTPQRISIAAETTGRVVVIPVIEGQKVKRGQLLIKLNDADELANISNAGAALLQAKSKLRQLREVVLPLASQSLDQANSNLEQLRRQLARTTELKEKGFISQAQLDTAKRDFDVAKSQVSSARLQVQTNQAEGSDLAIANAAIALANSSLKLAIIKHQEDTILAPADGILISRNVEVGDTVQLGKELMVLAANGQTQIAVLLDEKNIAKIAINQPAMASADAFADQRFNAVVSFINPGIDATRGSVEIKLRVANPPVYLRQDMTVSVDIVTAHRVNTLVISSATLHDASGEKPWVMLVRNKRTSHQFIKLGLRGDNHVEVLGGLKDGDALLLANVGSIKANQRVRIHKNTNTNQINN